MIATDRGGSQPIVALVSASLGYEEVIAYFPDGRHRVSSEHPLDLIQRITP